MDQLAGKKILLVITKSNWGGAQLYVYTLAKEYAQRGAEVIVALGGTGEIGAETGLLATRLQEAGIPVRFLSSFARDISTRHELNAFSTLTKLILDIRPDVLHLNSSKAGGLGALAGRLVGVPRIVFTAHGWAHREPRHPFKKFLIKAASWATIVLSDVVIVVSNRDYVDAPVFFSRRKLTLIRNGISEFGHLESKDARLKLSEVQSIPINETWLLALGELHTNKGFDVAIRAFAQIVIERPHTVLVIIGEGEERNSLEELIQKLNLSTSVFLLGFIPNPRQYLAAADLFLVSSRKEGLPFALLEAGLVGLPVIATSIGGIPEVIQNNVTGLLIRPNNVMSMVEAMRNLLENKVAAHEMAQKLKVKIQKDFSEEAMISETIATYFP